MVLFCCVPIRNLPQVLLGTVFALLPLRLGHGELESPSRSPALALSLLPVLLFSLWCDETEGFEYLVQRLSGEEVLPDLIVCCGTSVADGGVGDTADLPCLVHGQVDAPLQQERENEVLSRALSWSTLGLEELVERLASELSGPDHEHVIQVEVHLVPERDLFDEEAFLVRRQRAHRPAFHVTLLGSASD